MASKYTVNWEKDEEKGNVIKEGRTLIIETKPKTPMFSAVILKDYKKTGRNWTGKPVLVAQERFNQADGVLEIKLKQKSRGKTKNIKPGKYLLKTWIAHPKTYASTMYNDEFEIV